MFSEILERFIKDSPIAVMVRALLENLLNADKIDRWFEGVRQKKTYPIYQRNPIFIAGRSDAPSGL